MSDKLTDIVTRLRIRWDAMGDMANDERAAAATEIERLRVQRDEARREVCNMTSFHGLPRDYARERGWDCFKEKP